MLPINVTRDNLRNAYIDGCHARPVLPDMDLIARIMDRTGLQVLWLKAAMISCLLGNAQQACNKCTWGLGALKGLRQTARV